MAVEMSTGRVKEPRSILQDTNSYIMVSIDTQSNNNWLRL